MDVKAGYKQTDIGVIPVDWGTISLFDACSKIQDGTHFSPRVGGNDYLYITSKNIRFGFLDLSTASRIDAAQHRAIYRRCDVKKGDLLLTKDGANTGNAALNILDEEFSLLSSVALLRFDEKRHLAAYFLQEILTSPGQRQIQDAMAGNAITRLTLEKINKLRFPAPPTKAEEEALAQALSDADALIESLAQLLAKKRHVKQGAMQELLAGKKRLPGFAKSRGQKQTEIGVVPEDWSVTPLGRLVFSVEYGSSAKSSPKGQIPVLRMGNLQGGKIDWRELVFTDNPSEISRYTLLPGDVLFNRTNTIELVGKTAIYQGEQPALFAGYLIRIKVAPVLLDSRFLNYVLNTELSRKHSAKVLSVAVGQANINGQKLKTYPIPLPPTVGEQTAIATILSDMDAEIVASDAKLAKARQIKQGMMQELLTGRVRFI